jgi:hypothetical protein
MTDRMPVQEMTISELAAFIDHSVLKLEFTPDEVKREVENGVRFGCRTVCIDPSAIEFATPIVTGDGHAASAWWATSRSRRHRPRPHSVVSSPAPGRYLVSRMRSTVI